MCYGAAHLINERMSLPSGDEYFYSPLPEQYDLFFPDLPRLVVDVVLPEQNEFLFVEEGMAVYVSRGRTYQKPAPSLPLPPREHGTGGLSSAQGPALMAGPGRAALTAAFLTLHDPDHSRN